jgi:hypothetical protein
MSWPNAVSVQFTNLPNGHKVPQGPMLVTFSRRGKVPSLPLYSARVPQIANIMTDYREKYRDGGEHR